MRASLTGSRLATLAVACAALAGCFVDTPQPPAFRFECGSDADCTDPERCLSGLCQVPCTFASFADDCPEDDGYATCFNGACANTCSTEEKDPCPGEQTCVAIPSGDSGGFGMDLENLGVCGDLCQAADADACPADELCIEGLCVPLEGGDAGTEDTGGTGA